MMEEKGRWQREWDPSDMCGWPNGEDRCHRSGRREWLLLYLPPAISALTSQQSIHCINRRLLVDTPKSTWSRNHQNYQYNWDFSHQLLRKAINRQSIVRSHHPSNSKQSSLLHCHHHEAIVLMYQSWDLNSMIGQLRRRTGELGGTCRLSSSRMYEEWLIGLWIDACNLVVLPFRVFKYLFALFSSATYPCNGGRALLLSFGKGKILWTMTTHVHRYGGTRGETIVEQERLKDFSDNVE